MHENSFFPRKPSIEEYAALLGEFTEDFSEEEALEQLERLSDSYFLLFPKRMLADFAGRLASLGEEKPYCFEVSEEADGLVELRIWAIEKSSFFSLVAGSLSAAGLDIESGDIFTYRSAGRTREFHNRSEWGHAKLVDIFRGRWEEGVSGGVGSTRELERIFSEALELLFSRGDADESGVEKARQKVAEELSKRLLSRRVRERVPPLYPVEIDVDEDEGGSTRLRVRSQDTPYFLYTLGTVFALHDISIEHVEIKTQAEVIEDTFHLRTSMGRPINNPQKIDSLKFSILFTKQFTHFLWNAPDPYRALLRFETLVRELYESKGEDSFSSLIADPNVLRRLSRLLGASDFLWEDFFRLQYENILPLLSGESEVRQIDTNRQGWEEELQDSLEEAADYEEKKRVLNDFKDKTTYLVDLEHILDPEVDFTFLSEHLSSLADLVVKKAFELAWDKLEKIYGTPRTVADLPTVYTVAGLGKFGGKALGYASDIELLFLYRDAGTTSGPKSIRNGEFFSHLVREASSLIESKREGIYEVDLRLRPHGAGGPLAVSLAQFLSYYRHEASSLEKLALVRLRAVAGDEEFSAQVERLRDVIMYEGESIDVEELIRLRRVQAEKYSSPERVNVKYGPGGLLDLEYCIQILQVLEGKKAPELRTPYLHEAFGRLGERGTLDGRSTSMLERTYFFFRRLINALRMLRGNALDLYLPERNSPEFLHLARRMGYVEAGGVPAEELLFVEYRKSSAVVRSFVEQRLGSHAVIHSGMGTIADLLLSDRVEDRELENVFSRGGFYEPKKGLSNFSALMNRWNDTSRFIDLALLAWDYLRNSPDPDMALNNWELFTAGEVDAQQHFEQVHGQPKRLEILLRIFSASRFLADLLIHNPGFFDEVTDPDNIHRTLGFREFYPELSEIRHSCDKGEWRRQLRRFRHRNILRTGSRDICYGATLEDIFTELSGLAEAELQAELDYLLEEGGHIISEEGLCILAFGKLGGRELNYSSDIDLVVVCEDDSSEIRGEVRKLVQELRRDIAEMTEDGMVYRIDFRLRPYGGSGELVFTPRQMEEYYQKAALLWEFQALLKARPVAGNRDLGERLLERIYKRTFPRLRREDILSSVGAARHIDGNTGENAYRAEEEEQGIERIDVKEGIGGLRDIEFLVQALQLINASTDTRLICENTLEAIELLREAVLLDREAAETLAQEYRFLRRIEHFLQLLEDRQVHSIPDNDRAIEALSGRMRWTEICKGNFSNRLRSTLKDVRALFEEVLLREGGRPSKM